MSASLIERLQQLKIETIQRGTIISLRKEEVTKEKLVGKNYKLSYSWYQTPSKVGIEIPHTIDSRDDLKVQFEDERVIIDFPINGGGHYHLDLNLFSRIVPQKSKKNHRLTNIQIVMQKKKNTQVWPYLRRDGLGIPEAVQQQKMLYPTSNKNPKNWDKIDREIEGDILKHGQQFGQDPGANFFKQIFRNGDPQKRKAMMKSFQTSGGTVLSTDWGDVSKKDYQGKDRPSPPKGSVWKKPEY